MAAEAGGMASQPVMWNSFANMASFADKALTIVRGEGATVFDEAGRPYLDALASLWYCNVGHGRAEIADAAAAQMRQLAGYQTFDSFSNPPAEALARRIAGLAPVPEAKVFFTPGGGSDAIDTAAKLARAYWHAEGRSGKQIVISRAHAYHGMNAYGTTLGGIPANAEPFGPLVAGVEHVPWDDAEALDKLIGGLGADRVGAFFCEPVIGAGGVYPPPEGYLARVQEICRLHDVLFIADEVITGFGRLGSWLGSGRFGLEPDMIITAKGLTSGYAPLGAVIVGPRVAEPFWRPGSDRGIPARLHLLRASHRVRRRPGQPRPDRARAADQPGGRSSSRCWRPGSRRLQSTIWSARCGPAPACSPRWRSPRTPVPRIRASARGWWPGSATAA